MDRVLVPTDLGEASTNLGALPMEKTQPNNVDARGCMDTTQSAMTVEPTHSSVEAIW